MRAELTAVVRRVHGELARQATHRLTRAVRPALDGPTAWVQHRRVPVVARIDPELRLRVQEQALRQALVAELERQGIGHWWLPVANRSDVLCVGQEDRHRVLEVLAGLAGPSWYVDVLAESGEPRGLPTPVLAPHPPSRLASAPGLLVWEYVAPTADSTFLSDSAQGVRLYFWQRTDGRRVSCVTNQTALELPAGLDGSVAVDGTVPAMLARPSSSAVGFPIDVVYTWVDGDDDAWLRSKAEAAGIADPEMFTERAHDASRYADHDELRFSLRALEQFAPWVNHVWIVTADQHPAWLRGDHPWVTVVSHRDIWPDAEGLPTFNSHAIEACLHRIPGLAEHFLYLNDDMLLARPVTPETFFHANGIGKFFSSNALVDYADSAAGEVASTSAAKNARRLIGDRYGVTFSRKFFHTAACLTVSGLRELEVTFPEVIEQSRRAPFRTLSDVATAGSFYLNWAYVTGRAVPGRIRYTYIDPAAPDAERRLTTLTRRRVFDTICVNDGSTAQTPDERRETDRLIRAFFAAYLPVPGTFELPTSTGP